MKDSIAFYHLLRSRSILKKVVPTISAKRIFLLSSHVSLPAARRASMRFMGANPMLQKVCIERKGVLMDLVSVGVATGEDRISWQEHKISSAHNSRTIRNEHFNASQHPKLV